MAKLVKFCNFVTVKSINEKEPGVKTIQNQNKVETLHLR